MDENRLYGTARNVGGKVEEGVGHATGDVKTQIQGKLDQAAGAAQDLYGQTARRTRYSCEPRQMAAQYNRDPALHDGNRGARHRLAPRQDAQAALIEQIEHHGRLGAAAG